MNLRDWIAAFRKLHQRAARNELDPQEMKTYLAGRDELARAVVASQRLTLRAGQTPRQALRVARALPIDLDLTTGRTRALTADLSRGGFSALVELPPPASEAIGFTLKLPGSDPVIGRCQLVSSAKRQGGSFSASFSFQDLGEPEQDRIERLLFDTVLEQFRDV